MTHAQFFNKHLGRYLDFDGAYGAQCVDLFRFYVKDVLGLPQPRGVVGAADFWTNYDSDQVLSKNFQKIKNTPDFVPQEGDIAIWNRRAGGGYGHIAIVHGRDHNTDYFHSADQNYPTGSVIRVVKHNYTNFFGVLRPNKKEDDNMNDNDYGDMVYKSSQYDNVVYKIVDKNANPRQTEYTVVVDKYNRVVSESKSKDEDVKECRLEKNALSEEKKRLEQDNEQLAAENLQLKTKVSSLETASKHSRAQLDNTKKVVQEQSAAIDELEQKLRVEKENHKQTHNNYVKCKDTNIELERRVTKLENELSDPSIAELVRAILRKIMKGLEQ